MSFKLTDFDFILPEELIAEKPLEVRHTSKLLHLNKNGEIADNKFSDIIDLIKPSDLIILNDTKVICARLAGNIKNKKVEITLLKQIDSQEEITTWSCLCKPAKKFNIGDKFYITEDIFGIVLEKKEYGEISISFPYSEQKSLEIFEKYGRIPLPPYIEKKRKAEDIDKEIYQTVFAKNSGSVAAPTAGLHFSEEILNKIKEKCDLTFVTLTVGGGTFLPVRNEDLSEHKMHAEFYSVPKQTIQKIIDTKKSGGRVICVGTTSLRTIESAFNEHIEVIKESGDTEIFITPGYKFKVVDCLITNFHLPKSTLLMLVSAFSGFDEIRVAYRHAIDKKYRFFSYGDACFLEKK